MPKKAVPFIMPEDDVIQLKSIVRMDTIDARTYKRAKILILKNQGMSINAVANKLDIAVNAVKLCLAKYKEGGLEMAFSDKAGRGRKQEISDDSKIWVISVACMKPTDLGYSSELWFPRLLRDYVRENAVENGHPRLKDVSTSTIRTILEDANIKPHKIRYYCDKKDPDFDRRVNEKCVQKTDATDDTERVIIVESSKELAKRLEDEGYRIWHKPYFAMPGYTHSKWTVKPDKKEALDAAKNDLKAITAEEFIKTIG